MVPPTSSPRHDVSGLHSQTVPLRVAPFPDRSGRRAAPFARRLLEIAGVAGAYLIAGKLALLLALPPGYATAVWPAAGLALAAVLRLGNRVWPGILLGSFLVNLRLPPDAGGAQHPDEIARALAIPACIAAGAALQALAGGALLRRFVGPRVPLYETRAIFTTLLLGGPASCLINATLGVTTLWLSGVIPPVSYPFSWGTWWAGDSIGVMIFTPLLLIWGTKHEPGALRRRLSVTIPMMVTFSLVVALFVVSSRREERRLRSEFEAAQGRTELAAGLDAAAYRVAHPAMESWAVLVSGLLFTALLGALLLVVTSRTQLTEQEVALRTRELVRVNDLLERTHAEWQHDEREIRRLNQQLERGIAERTAELAQAHEDLQTAFRHKSMLLSEIQQYSQQMEQQAMEDSLTRLSNRRYFDLHFAREVSRAQRFGRELTLALADIDGFKGINDNFSHALGDKVLISVGGILQRMSRQSDLVARWGGDEFVIVMPETTLARGAVLCERIRRIVERFPWHNIHPGLKVTLSIGLSGEDPAAGPETLAGRADKKLYEAKNSGRNRVRH